jgi:hypothetical protein
MKQRMILARMSDDEATFAVLTWTGVPRRNLLEALQAALREWLTSKEGKEAMTEAGLGADFNIGDLANLGYDQGRLKQSLEEQNLRELAIEIYSDPHSTFGLEFDTPLLRSAEQEDDDETEEAE